jgi:hypothetical protein
METTAKHLHLPPTLAAVMNLEAGTDARAVRWMPLVPDTVRHLYASHCELVRATLGNMACLDCFTDRDRHSVLILLGMI